MLVDALFFWTYYIINQKGKGGKIMAYADQDAEIIELYPTLDVFLNEWIPELPQKDVIDSEDATNWYESVVAVDPDRFHWHFTRLKGIGGSDMGELVADHMGFANNFKTPHSLFEDKLMKNPIVPQNNVMRRGTYLEPVTQRIFQEDFNCTTRQDLVEKINHSYDPERPWLRGNVDDVVSMEDGSIFVVDYKSSTEAPNHTVIQYAAQLHQYEYLLSLDDGVQADGLLVVYFDYPNGQTQPIEVPFDPEIRQAMLDAGDKFWNCVLTGEPPEIKSDSRTRPDFDEQELATIEEMEDEIVKLSLIADASKELKNKKQNELTSFLNNEGQYTLKNVRLPMQTCQPRITQTIDHQTLSNIVDGMNLDKSEILSVGKKLDEKKVKELIKQNKMKIKDFYAEDFDPQKIVHFCEKHNIEMPVKESVSYTLTPDNKGERLDRDMLNKAKSHTKEFIENNKNEIGFEFALEDIENSISLK